MDAKDNYDKKFCQKCKKLLPPYDNHSCERCGFRLCRQCDDTSELLRWVDMGDNPDQYICYKCAGEKKKRKKKETTTTEQSQES